MQLNKSKNKNSSVVWKMNRCEKNVGNLYLAFEFRGLLVIYRLCCWYSSRQLQL